MAANIAHSIEQLACPECGEKVARKYLNLHRHNRHGVPYPAPADDRGRMRKTTLKAPSAKATLNGTNPHKVPCGVCGKVLSRKNMAQHMNRMHGGQNATASPEKPTQIAADISVNFCPECGCDIRSVALGVAYARAKSRKRQTT